MRILMRMENRELHRLQFSHGQWKHLCTAKARAPSPSPQKTSSLSSPLLRRQSQAPSPWISHSPAPLQPHIRVQVLPVFAKLVVLPVFTKFIYVHISGSFVHFVLKLLILEPLRMCVY
jgi:hypothetical protein